MPDFAKVLDFGLVKDANSDPRLSAETGLRGTPLYMAPESVRTPDDVDGRADVYAVGCVAYFLLVGKPVFASDNLVEVLSSHLHEKPVPPSRAGHEVPQDLEALVMSCLEKDRTLRPQSATALRAAIDELECCGRWRDTDARRWWAERAGAVRSRRDQQRAGAEIGAIAVTLALDPGRRTTMLDGAPVVK